MARYVIASRRSGRFTRGEKVVARGAMDMLVSRMPGGVAVVEDRDPPDPTARRVILVEASAAQARSIAQALPGDVILEPEILHWPGSGVPPADFASAHRRHLDGPVSSGAETAIDVRVTGAGRPLGGAAVTAYLRGWGRIERSVTALTDADGHALVRFGDFFRASALRIDPAGGFWSMMVRGPAAVVDIDCPALPEDGPLGWWHRALGLSAPRADAGRGIRIGVIDTGAGPHPALDRVRSIGAFIGGDALAPEEGRDVDGHGSHVCGIIGAQPVRPGAYAGIAPGADILSARVFAPGAGANQADIANAIDALSHDHRVDLINMSLGAPQASEIERDAIADAFERGTLCVCAAANSAGPVEYPAAFPETVAVSALGLLGWGPPGSVAASRVPDLRDAFGIDNLFLANFSCYGPEIDCAAPGVGIISTVPERGGMAAAYAAFDGTSMASPAASAVLAVVLGDDAVFAALPRNQTRAAYARRRLIDACRDIALSPDRQGRGIPTVGATVDVPAVSAAPDAAWPGGG